MLTIRNEQKAAFTAAIREGFESEVHGYLCQCFPADCAALGEAQTRVVVGVGIDRAGAHAFRSRRDVYDYISLMFRLGSYFDEDPLLPWAAEVLAAEEGAAPDARMDELYTRAEAYLTRTRGDDGSYYREAILRARERPLGALPSVSGPRDVADDLQAYLSDLYPAKCAELGEASLSHAIRLCRARVDAYGMATGRGPALYAGLMFLFGGHFDRDPLHPWAGAVLHGEPLSDAVLKAERLHEAAMARLDQSLTST